VFLHVVNHLLLQQLADYNLCELVVYRHFGHTEHKRPSLQKSKPMLNITTNIGQRHLNNLGSQRNRAGNQYETEVYDRLNFQVAEHSYRNLPSRNRRNQAVHSHRLEATAENITLRQSHRHDS
jgi:hypothetical protein